MQKENLLGTKFVIVTIKGTSALLMHAYPMADPPKGWEKWGPEEQAKISEYRDPDTGMCYIPGVNIQNELRQVVDDAGSRCGLLDFRPEKKGPFGRFMVTSWQG